MATAATPARRIFFMWISLERLRKDERSFACNQLTVWKGTLCYQDVILLPFVSSGLLNHAEQPRQPQRNLRHISDQAQENQHRAQPWQHRDRDFADPHLCDAAGNV